MTMQNDGTTVCADTALNTLLSRCIMPEYEERWADGGRLGINCKWRLVWIELMFVGWLSGGDVLFGCVCLWCCSLVLVWCLLFLKTNCACHSFGLRIIVFWPERNLVQQIQCKKNIDKCKGLYAKPKIWELTTTSTASEKNDVLPC